MFLQLRHYASGPPDLRPASGGLTAKTFADRDRSGNACQLGFPGGVTRVSQSANRDRVFLVAEIPAGAETERTGSPTSQEVIRTAASQLCGHSRPTIASVSPTYSPGMSRQPRPCPRHAMIGKPRRSA